MPAQYDAVDCQGFAGGMTLGVVQAGFRLVGKREMRGGFGVANCVANRGLLGHAWDVEAIDPEEWTPKDVPLVFGNPPCSGFSLLSRSDFRGSKSPINACMRSLMSFAARCRPEFIVMESVQQAFRQGRDLMQELRAQVEVDTGESWTAHHVLHNAASVGGAAIRRRYFLVLARGGRPFGLEQPKVERVPSLNEVIGDLAGMGLSWERQPYRRPPTWYTESYRSSSGAVDGHMNRQNTPHARRAYDLMLGTHWDIKEPISKVARRYYETHGKLPDSWATTEAKLIANDFTMGFNQLIRWNGDKMARVITGGGLDLTLHPTEDRLVTHREVHRIMGFPDDWLLRPLRGTPGLQLTPGKGVTVACGRWIGEWVKRALDDDPGSDTGEEIGDREWLFDCTDAFRNATLER